MPPAAIAVEQIAAPSPGTTTASFPLSATSRVLDTAPPPAAPGGAAHVESGYVSHLHAGGAIPDNGALWGGASLRASALYHEPGAPVTSGDPSSGGSLSVSGPEGLYVGPVPGKPPSVARFSVVVAAFPSGAAPSGEAALELVMSREGGVSGRGAHSEASVRDVAGGTFLGSLQVEGLVPGTDYDFLVAAFDAAHGVGAAYVVPVSTNADPVITSVTSVPWFRTAVVTVEAHDPDSHSDLMVAAVPMHLDAGAAEAALLMGAPAGDASARAEIPPSPSPLPYSLRLTPLREATDYRVVAVARDRVTGRVVRHPPRFFSTYLQHSCSVRLLDSAYSSVIGEALVSFYAGTLTVRTAVVPASPGAVEAFARDGVDPLGTLRESVLTSPGAHALPIAATGLLDGTDLYLVAAALPQGDEAAETVSHCEARTLSRPSAVFSGAASTFTTAEAVVSFNAGGSPSDAYAASVPATVPDDEAASRLMSLGSAAYPGALAVRGAGDGPISLRASGLEPGSAYKWVFVATPRGYPGAPPSVRVRHFSTAPPPSLSAAAGAYGPDFAEFSASTAAASPCPFETVAHLSESVVAGEIAYDEGAVLSEAGSDPMTLTLGPAVRLDSAPLRYAGLRENARHGLVVLALEGGVVLSRAQAIRKTAAAPDLLVDVVAVTATSLSYRVEGGDADGGFSVAAAVLPWPATAGGAEGLLRLGASHPDALPGSVVTVPLAEGALLLPGGASGLQPDTEYAVVAAAEDVPTGVVVWGQARALTDALPGVTISSLSPLPGGLRVEADLYGRDGPSLAITARAYPGRPAFVSASDAWAAEATAVSPGSGPRPAPRLDLLGLDPGAEYTVVAVAADPKGNESAPSSLAGTAGAPPSLSIPALEWGAEKAEGYALVGAAHAGAVVHRALLEGLRPGLGEGEARAVAAGTAEGLLQSSPETLPGGAEADASIPLSFGGLSPGGAYTAVAVVLEPLLGLAVWDFVPAHARVDPEIVLSVRLAGPRSAELSVAVAYRDPDESRESSAAVASGAAPGPARPGGGGAPPAWLAPGGEDPLGDPVDEYVHVSPGAVLVRGGVGVGVGVGVGAGGPTSQPRIRSLSGLSPASQYTLYASAVDSATGRSAWGSLSFVTRAEVDLKAEVIETTKQGARYSVSASLSDGTFSLRARAFPAPEPAPADPGDPASWVTDEMREAARAGGDLIASGEAHFDGEGGLNGLRPASAYALLVMASDDASGGELEAWAIVPFETPPSPPRVSLARGSAVARSTRATVRAQAADDDSPFTVYWRAWPWDPSSPSPTGDQISGTSESPGGSRHFPRSTGGGSATFPVGLSGLAPSTPYLLVAVAADGSGGESHDFMRLDTAARDTDLDMAEYDGAWTIRSRSEATYSRGDGGGFMVANGKSAVVPSQDGFWARRCFLAGAFDFNEFGGFTNNIVDSFDATRLSLNDHSGGADAYVASLASLSLNMQAGVSTAAGALDPPASRSPAASRYAPLLSAPTPPLPGLTAEVDILPLRHVPYATLVQYHLTPDADADDLPAFHEIVAPDCLAECSFDSTRVYNGALGRSVDVFSGRGVLRGSRGGREVACACVYLPGDGLQAAFEGFNAFRHESRAFNALRLSGLKAGARSTLSVLVVQASSGDFASPAEEAARIAVSLLRRGKSPGATASSLRARHVLEWEKAWRANVTLEPKAGITVGEEDSVLGVKRALRYAMYNLHISVRDNVPTEVNPMQIGTLDVDGNLFWNRDLWVIPALLYTNPRAARSMIEYRWLSLSSARALAASQGMEGARFPHARDVVGYENAPYWDVSSASFVFNTALVCLNCWNYFRVTLDRSWLSSRGYDILAAAADFISSATEVLPSGRGVLRGVLDLNSEERDSPAFSVYACKVALKHAIEACYELTYAVRHTWLDAFYSLDTEFHSGANFELIRAHDGASPSDRVRLPESLFVLHPHYSAEFYEFVQTTRTNDESTLRANAEHYGARIDHAYSENPFNLLLQATLWSRLARYDSGADPKRLRRMEELFLAAVDRGAADKWGNLSAGPGGAAEFNDVSLSAMLALAFLAGVAGQSIEGGVAESQFYYKEMIVKTRPTAVMPPTWESVKVGRVWPRPETVNVINEMVYTYLP